MLQRLPASAEQPTMVSQSKNLELLEESLLCQRVHAPETNVLIKYLERETEKSYLTYFELALEVLSDFSSLGIGTSDNTSHERSDATSDRAFRVIRGVANIVRHRDSPDLTIDEIIGGLIGQPDMNDASQTLTPKARKSLRRAVFASIGYLTCLYLPGNDPANNVLAIDVQRTRRVPATAISIGHASRRIQGMLKNFGELFPEYPPSSGNGSTLYSSRLNYFSLHRLSNVQVKWVDVLSAHLEFDSTTKQLALFRFPSFCLLNSRRTRQPSAFHW